MQKNKLAAFSGLGLFGASVALYTLLGSTPITIEQPADPTTVVQITTPTSYYVDPVAGSDLYPCSYAQPCRTEQAACNLLLGKIITDDVTIYTDAGYAGTGCRLEPLLLGEHSLSDGGVKIGTLTLAGTPAVYGDAGTITAVTAGSAATGARDLWSVTGNHFLNVSLVGKWVKITGGTGSTSDRKWQVYQNDAGVMEIQSMGRASQPAAGSTYQLYQAPGTVCNADLGQTIKRSGPEGIGQTTASACFIITVAPTTSLNGAADSRLVTIQDWTTTGSATLVRANGPVTVREAAHQSSGSLYRGLAGVVSPTIERSYISSGTAGIFRNSDFHVTTQRGQFYNNVCAPAVVNGFHFGQVQNLWSDQNFCPGAVDRVGGAVNARWVNSTLAGLRITGEQDPSTSPDAIGVYAMDGVNLTGTGQAYAISAMGPSLIQVDWMGGAPASTITAVASSHAAALSHGAGLMWNSTTTFDGAGTRDIVFTATSSTGVLASDIRARTPPTWRNWDGSWAMQFGGSHIRSNIVGPELLLSLYPHAVNLIRTWGGTKPSQAFTVTDVVFTVDNPVAGAGTNNTIRISDGTNNCDATFSCTTLSSIGPKRAATSGTCDFAALAELTVSETVAGCTPDPVLQNVALYGRHQ